MSFAAVGVTAACLLLMGTFALIALNVAANLKGLEAENELLAFVDESYTREEARAMEQGLINFFLTRNPIAFSFLFGSSLSRCLPNFS